MTILDLLTNKYKIIRFNKKWRKNNQHNSTSCANVFNDNIVTVGNHSYGALSVYTFGNADEKLAIGNYVSIAQGVMFILGGNHPYKFFSTFPFKVRLFGEKKESTTKGAIIVKDDVWIGTNVIIMSGLTIGQGAIIGAGSVVSKDIPPYAIAVGNPAKVVAFRFEEKIREELLKIDFSKISTNFLMQNKNILYSELNAYNYVDFVKHLTDSY